MCEHGFVHESMSNRRRPRRVHLALLVVATGCNGDPPDLSPPPADLDKSENLVLEGTMSPGLEAYELAAELTFYGVGVGEHNRECERYAMHWTTETLVAFGWSRRVFKQRRGVFSREEDGSVRFVVPLDMPTQPVCDWQTMRLRSFLVRDGREVARLGSLDRYIKKKRNQEANTDVVRLEVAVTCAHDTGEPDDSLRCRASKRGGMVVETVPIGPHHYKLDLRYADCPEAGAAFWDCLEENIDFPDEVRYQSSSDQ